jgi:hypothetical protein
VKSSRIRQPEACFFQLAARQDLPGKIFATPGCVDVGEKDLPEG